VHPSLSVSMPISNSSHSPVNISSLESLVQAADMDLKLFSHIDESSSSCPNPDEKRNVRNREDNNEGNPVEVFRIYDDKDIGQPGNEHKNNKQPDPKGARIISVNNVIQFMKRLG